MNAVSAKNGFVIRVYKYVYIMDKIMDKIQDFLYICLTLFQQ